LIDTDKNGIPSTILEQNLVPYLIEIHSVVQRWNTHTVRWTDTTSILRAYFVHVVQRAH